jgi:hypothetical protein
VPISILGNNADPMDNSNATTQYAWNLGTFAITNENTILIQFRGVNSGTYTILNVTFGGTTIQDVCNALNTLNLGSFFVTTSGANSIINNYNQNIVFGFLTIYSPTTTSLNYTWSMSGAGGKADILRNLVPQVTDVSPITTSGSVSVVGGDSIRFDQTATNTLPTTFSVYNLTTSTFLYNVTLPISTGTSFTFPIVTNNSYLLIAQN